MNAELRKLRGRTRPPRGVSRRVSSLRLGSTFALRSIGALSFLAAQASAHEVSQPSAPGAPSRELVSLERSTSLNAPAPERAGQRPAELHAENPGLSQAPSFSHRVVAPEPPPRTHPADYFRRLHVARLRGRDPPELTTSPN